MLAIIPLLLGLAAVQGRPLDLSDYYRIETVSSPALSPHGRFVAFVRSYIVEAENRRASEVWLAATDGSAPPVRLTDPSLNASDPRWSPDGTLLAFTARPRGHPRVSPIWFLQMDPRGSEPFQIAGVEGTPIFSPDNQWIAFTRATPPPPPPGASSEQTASDLERLIARRFTGRVYDWMNYRFDQRGYLPDGRDPQATPPDELYIVPRAGGTPRPLTRLGVSVRGVAWRPDSRALAIIADSSQRDEYSYGQADLWVVDLNGRIRRLTSDGYDYTAPGWSPDGRSLVFRREQGLSLVIRAHQAHGAPVDLYRMAADGGVMENLTGTWDYLPGAPVWSPDGRFVYFPAGIGGNEHLFRIPAGGGPVTQVTQGERQLESFSLSRRFDRMAYTSSDPTHPAVVCTARADGGGERTLSRFNDSLLAAVDLRPAERLQYASKDGTRIEGWLTLPRGHDAAKGVPLILSIHGGPHSAYGNDFSFQFQLWAANGYAVLYTNPRGSTGYGESFLWATWGGWGDLDSDDVLAGVDYALGHYAIDPQLLAVAGYSYGGFLTNWLITHTSRFAAAAVGAGISNWISDYGTADIPRTKESEFFGVPWEPRGRELLLRQSPIMYAGQVATPTLFIHGEADLRVPIEQGEQMYTALKKRRVPARFVRYPDTYHGGWTPWNTVHRYFEELRWWAQYLKR